MVKKNDPPPLPERLTPVPLERTREPRGKEAFGWALKLEEFEPRVTLYLQPA